MCIFVVCATERYYSSAHAPWACDFIANCERNGIDFYSPGNYQQRLQLFREMKEGYSDGLERCYYGDHHSWLPAREFNGVTPIIVCSGPFQRKVRTLDELMPCVKRSKDLMSCSRCKVVYYCSKECQRLHWKKHKQECAMLAAQRKDKEKITEMAKSLGWY